MEDFKYELVDLGLPSGTLWMDRNIGASTPEDAGLYFAWGETQGYTADEVGNTKRFDWESYKFGNTLTKYNPIDKLLILEPIDDAAYQYTDGKCRIPTQEQILELMNNTKMTERKQNGVKGALFTSKKNGKSIFFGLHGYALFDSINNVGERGGIWSITLKEKDIDRDHAYGLFFIPNDESPLNLRLCGYSIRGVA